MAKDLSFLKWWWEVYNKHKIWIKVVLPILIGAFLLGLKFLWRLDWQKLLTNSDIKNHLLTVQILQFFIITSVVLYLCFNKPPEHFKWKTSRRAKACNQFWHWWILIWVAWGVLYFILSAQNGFYPKPNEEQEKWLRVTLNFLNNISSIFFIMCFYVFKESSIVTNHINPAPNDRDELQWWNLHLILQPKTADKSKKPPYYIYIWIFLVVLLLIGDIFFGTEIRNTSASTPQTISPLKIKPFSIASDCLGAVAMALFIGKLDDGLLGIPSALIAILFFYIAIQPTFSLIIDNELGVPASIVIWSVALLCKLVFFMLIEWIARGGRLFYYMVASNEMYGKTPGNRELFFIEGTTD